MSENALRPASGASQNTELAPFDIQKSATATADVFRDEFPGQEPDLSWLAEAAAVDHVPDDQREEWEAEIRKAL